FPVKRQQKRWYTFNQPNITKDGQSGSSEASQVLIKRYRKCLKRDTASTADHKRSNFQILSRVPGIISENTNTTYAEEYPIYLHKLLDGTIASDASVN